MHSKAKVNPSLSKTQISQPLKMKDQLSIQKIQQINELSQSNNQALSNLKLRLSYTRKFFPDKFSQNPSDIYSTCEIQGNLIKQIKLLNQSQSKLLSTISSLSNEKTLEIQKQKRHIQELSKGIKDLSSRNSILQRFQKQNKELRNQITKLKNLNKRNTQKIEELNKQINRHCPDQSKLLDLKAEEVKRKNWIKNIEYIQNPVKILNSQCRKQQIKVNEYIKQFCFDQQTKKQKHLINQNEKIKDWVRKFVESIERILLIRLKKIREISPEQNNSIYHYLPKMNLNTMAHCFKSSEFPFAELLHDFEFVMKEAEQNRFEHEKFLIFNKTEMLNKDIVEILISQLRKFRSLAIDEFIKCGQKRQLLATQYQQLLQIDQNCLQLLRTTTIDKLRQFQIHPQRLLNQIQEELADFRKYRQKIQTNYQQIQPEFLTRRIQINKQVKATIADLKDEEKKQKRKQEYCNSQNQLQLKMARQNNENYLLEGIESEQDKTRRERKQLYEEGKRFVMEQLTKKSLEEQRKIFQNQLQACNDLAQLKNSYLDSLFPLQNQKNQNKNTEVLDTQPQKIQYPNLDMDNMSSGRHNDSKKNIGSSSSNIFNNNAARNFTLQQQNNKLQASQKSYNKQKSSPMCPPNTQISNKSNWEMKNYPQYQNQFDETKEWQI